MLFNDGKNSQICASVYTCTCMYKVSTCAYVLCLRVRVRMNIYAICFVVTICGLRVWRKFIFYFYDLQACSAFQIEGSYVTVSTQTNKSKFK